MRVANEKKNPPGRVRAGVLEDLPQLLALEAMFPGDRLSQRQFRHHLVSATARLRVVASGKRVQGYALILLRRNSRVARLYSIAVDPAARGLGLGQILLDDVVTQARKAGSERLRLEVRADNVAVIAWYRRSGFVEFGRIPGYYEDGCEALRCERQLASAEKA